jgi:hypothetical protein
MIEHVSYTDLKQLMHPEQEGQCFSPRYLVSNVGGL